MSQAYSGPALSIALRDGGSLDIWPDRIVADGRIYPLSELRGAVLSSDSATPAGTPVRPALALRGRDRVWATYVPAEPPDAERALGAILARRPELEAAAWLPGQIPPGIARGIETNQAVLAGIAHLSLLFAPLVLPLIIWVATQFSSPYASRQARQAFFFHLLLGVVLLAIALALVAVFVIAVVAGLSAGDARGAAAGLVLFPVCVLTAIGLVVAGIGYAIYAAFQAFQGRHFTYPFLRRL